VKLNAKLLKVFSQCPAAFLFTLKDKPPLVTEQERIIKDIIRKCIIRTMETSFRIKWRTIVGWVDKEIFSRINIDDKESFDTAKKNSEYALLALSTWYREIYSTWDKESFVDIQLETFQGNILIQDKISIITLTDPITCTLINKNFYDNKKGYYNDIEIKILAWLVSKELNCDIVNVQNLSLGVRGKMNINNIAYDREALYKTETYVRNICKVIENRYYYPSTNNECRSCDYYLKCNP